LLSKAFYAEVKANILEANTEAIKREGRQILDDWIASCVRGGKISRNTVAVGIVVFHQLRLACPVSKEDVISKGGEIKGARSGLGNILQLYGIPSEYLKEATTRQVHQDGQRLFEKLDWGRKLVGLSGDERLDLLLELIEVLSSHAREWLQRQNLKLDIDRNHAPTAWISLILERSKQHSGGVVEQHLIGAKLEKRFKNVEISNHPAHAGDQQTGREGDFQISVMVYHVTATPSRNVIQKCAANIKTGKSPILLVPSDQEYRAKALAQDEGIDSHLTIISIESFIALNIIELAAEEGKGFFEILKEILALYNRRLVEVETDLSLMIEVH
jgi:Domain of unknown function (DUF4928)